MSLVFMPKKTKKKTVANKTTQKTAKKASKKTTKSVASKTKKVVKKSSSRKAVAKKTASIKAPSRFARLRATALWRHTMYFGLRLCIVLFVALLGFTAYLDITIRKQFEGKKWALPAHVYTRPMELYVGQVLDRAVVEAELSELGYINRETINRVGSYRFSETELTIFQREFRFWDELREQQITRIRLSGDQISSISIESQEPDLHTTDSGVKQTEIIRLEPRLFGSVSPLSHEDRTLLKLEDVPSELIDGLIANEDRAFYSHFGVNPLGIARAMVRNIQAGRFVQGGSTLTQQLVKNYYLTSRQTLERKFIEMIMAILLEVHYSKDEILQAYLNEVHLSQAGNRAIHGFELASQYYYGRPLQELDIDQLAMLIGINNSSTRYNPIRNPNNATARRNRVLKTMFDQNVIDEQQYKTAIEQGLKLNATAQRAARSSYPSFMGFVRKNLRNDYQQDDLHNEGLQIHTTLNPRIQQTLEAAVKDELEVIEVKKFIPSGTLQVAAVVIRTDNGEVAAMIGDRKARFSGFNRAINAPRPVGSLLKPFVYLTALESPERYSLASLIDDKEIVVSQKGSPDWRPSNYDNQERGQVLLIDALAHSLNLPAVKLGMEVGVSNVTDTVKRAGYQGEINQYPSVLLGAVPMTVVDVGQLYLTLASGGFKTPIKGIRSVLSNDNAPLVRYPLDIEQVIEPEFNTLITYALQEVIRTGSARSISRGFKYDYGFAGKTGTTNDYRDSWFAGFSGNYLTVVWVGRDDNDTVGLTGSSGAAKVWTKVMQGIPQQRLELGFHEEILTKQVFYSQNSELKDCSLSRQMPILSSSVGLENISCSDLIQYDNGLDDELKYFEPANDGEQTAPKPTDKPIKKKTFWQRIFG